MFNANLRKAVAFSALMICASTAPAATYVYVSNAEVGDIGAYTLQADGTLQPGARAEAGNGSNSVAIVSFD